MGVNRFDLWDAKSLMRTKKFLLPFSLEELGQLIRDCVESELNKRFPLIPPNETELILKAKEKVKVKPELSLSQVALIFFYEKKTITRKNGDGIARDHGHNSGEKLFHWFIFFSSNANRTGEPTITTPKTFENKIKLFESVIKRLSGEAKSSATGDLNALKILFEKADY